jgi:uncharacterized protein with ParB-like and HNH nuclease domain
MKAAEKGHEKVAEALIDLNAELNLQNSVRTNFFCVCKLFFRFFIPTFLYFLINFNLPLYSSYISLIILKYASNYPYNLLILYAV